MPVLFISRGTISGAHLLVDCLHQRTGIHCISREDLVKIVNQHGELATRIVEKIVKGISAYDQFSELRWPYKVLMRNALLEEIRGDNVVYHGYSGHLLLPTLRHFIRVRIEAPFNLRVQMTMKRLDCDEQRARDYIIEADDQRIRWARYMYGQDIRNTLLYDFHLNQERVTLEGGCTMLQCIMADKDFQATAESRAEVERLHLAASIETALVTDSRTQGLEISAVVQGKLARLIGPYLEEPELAAVKQIALGVAGIENVQYSPGYASRLEVNSLH